MDDSEEDLDLPMPNLYRLVHDPAFSSQLTNRILARMEQEMRQSMATATETPPERGNSELRTLVEELTTQLSNSNTEISDLRRQLSAANAEIENLQQQRCCIICLTGERGVLLPCKHVCVCETCFAQLNGKCPVCRGVVNSILNVYFP